MNMYYRNEWFINHLHDLYENQAVQNNEIIVTKNPLTNSFFLFLHNMFKFVVSFGQSLLGLQFLNSNKSGEMADILKTLQNKYVAKN